MSTSITKPPKYALHKATGQARVRLNGKSIYLGVHDTPESHQKYDEFIASLPASKPDEPPTPLEPAPDKVVTVGECALLFYQHAIKYYVRADGTPTGEHVTIRCALKPMIEMFGDVPAIEFGPKRLKAVREKMIALDWSRRYVNKAVNLIRRCFKWAASEELVSGQIAVSLACVQGLQAGRSDAREKDEVRSVADADVEAVLPRVSGLVGDVIRVMRSTGMRPGEVLAMTAAEIDRSDPSLWVYRPAHHKTTHKGKTRVVFIGVKAQEILSRRIVKAGIGKLFPIARASLRTSIHRGCERAGVPNWHPNQIRHTVGTEMRRDYGLEAAQVVLGQSRADVTQIYAERDMAKAQDVARKIG